MALGARPAQLVRMVLAETFIASTLGTSAGIVAAWILSRYLKSVVFGITIHDPLAFNLSPAILMFPTLTLRQD